MPLQHCTTDFVEAQGMSKKAMAVASAAFDKITQNEPPSDEIVNAFAKIVDSLQVADRQYTRIIETLARRS